MKVPSIHTPSNDDNGEGRIGRLLGLIVDLQAEVDREQDGLRIRHERTIDRDGLREEDADESRGLSDKVEALTAALRHYAEDVAALEMQRTLLGKLEAEVRYFLGDQRFGR
jgi:hypothetical protein